MKIVRLSASNVLRLKAVEIEPDGTLQVITGKNAQGKAQPLSEPVLTPDGWKPMGDISVGDEVIGVDGRPVSVIGVYPQQGREVWQVAFADGSSTRCTPDHLWTVSSWNSKAEWVEQTLTLREIVEQGIYIRDRARRWSVPFMAPLDLPRAPLPIEPYALGVILGDGNISDTGYVQLSTDAEIISSLGVEGYVRKSRGCVVLGSGEWSFRLEALGLAGMHAQDKFVPAEYFRGSIEQRSALLAGLLDTDGSNLSSGSVEFSSTSLQLVDAVVELARGLGGFAKVSKPRHATYTYNGQKMRSKLPSWRVRVRTDFNPFRLSRKRDQWTSPGHRRPLRRFIDSVKRVDDEATQCIRIASADGLYVTSNYVVTHNSSVLNAIFLALAGGDASRAIAKPVREGEDWAEVTVDLGELIVTRTWDKTKGEKATTKLTVQYADGSKPKRQQELLDALVGHLAFDPLAFTRLKPAEQREELLDLLGLDFAAEDAARGRLYSQREVTGQEKRALGVQPKLATDAPLMEKSASAIVDRITAEQDRLARIRELETRRDGNLAEADRLEAQAADLVDRAKRLREGATEVAATLDGMAKTTGEDLDALRAELAEVEDYNRIARENQAIRDKTAKQEQLAEEYSALSAQIDAIDRAKDEAIRAAKMPVDGLGVDDLGVTFNGQPLSQASSAEQIQVSMAIAIALHSELRVAMISDGSLLDADSLAVVHKMAAENDTQVLLEMVGDADSAGPAAIVIEDGQVVGL